MNEILRALIEANHVRQQDCEAKPANEQDQRITDIEDALIELAEIIAGGDENNG